MAYEISDERARELIGEWLDVRDEVTAILGTRCGTNYYDGHHEVIGALREALVDCDEDALCVYDAHFRASELRFHILEGAYTKCNEETTLALLGEFLRFVDTLARGIR